MKLYLLSRRRLSRRSVGRRRRGIGGRRRRRRAVSWRFDGQFLPELLVNDIREFYRPLRGLLRFLLLYSPG